MFPRLRGILLMVRAGGSNIVMLDFGVFFLLLGLCAVSV
jgi:hypothetical protein